MERPKNTKTTISHVEREGAVGWDDLRRDKEEPADWDSLIRGEEGATDWDALRIDVGGNGDSGQDSFQQTWEELDRMGQEANMPDKFKRMIEASREMTEQEKKMFSLAQEGLQQEREKLGLDTELHLPNVYIVPQEAWEQHYGDNGTGGFSAQFQNAIFIQDNPTRSKAQMLSHLYHELGHANDANKVIVSSEGKLVDSTSGLRMTSEGDGGQQLMWAVNEAMEEERAKRFVQEQIRTNPEFAEERAALDKYAEHFMDADDKVSARWDGDKVWSLEFARAEERMALERMITYMAGREGSTEEIFEVFTRAQITGDWEMMKSLLEAALGEGATVELAKDSQTTQGFVGFVENLVKTRMDSLLNDFFDDDEAA
ncbi:hypothetical protein FWH13_03160 [Candidatus Saccharibacteria bacterium]|nr:hypothetical protein [Candidatus Saccharibacteria bacterium]